MTDDLAFLFNDPTAGATPSAPGRTTHPSRPVPHAAPELATDINWMTLRQTHNQTSIPISTLRKWAKKGKVRARLVRTEGKDLRLVAFGDVVERARALERDLEPVEVEEVETVIDLRDPVDVVVGETLLPAPAAPAAGAYIAPVATVASASKAPEPPAAEEAPAVSEAPATQEGSILVPIDAWDRMLDQLGNLHEAGQQLADARERAAKAETEAEFLKERVREIRKRVEEAELALEVHTSDRLLPEAEPPPEPVLQIGWRRFRERWLGR